MMIGVAGVETHKEDFRLKVSCVSAEAKLDLFERLVAERSYTKQLIGMIGSVNVPVSMERGGIAIGEGGQGVMSSVDNNCDYFFVYTHQRQLLEELRQVILRLGGKSEKVKVIRQRWQPGEAEAGQWLAL